ncbi:DENN domain-containing protein 1A isoform X2 [Drosophila hydei]|uniref:DENN domain-containing protein 1A isoform X2 n=1 Tax=Drosophila hydei TaxID=7224 RepID=A0A6J1L7T1_DROHY|nr:DENN domain-containing protein 1A isoform X2 [Drosophila hydei]
MGSRIKNDAKKLFEFWCEVKPTHGIDRGSVNRNGGGTATPAGIITESFPEGFRDKEVLNGIPSFAFPCDLVRDSVQSYSFVHTTGDSKWRFGFCRHDPKTETAMVLITYLPWHGPFLKLLTVLADLKRTDLNEFRTFLSEAYNRGIPDAGGSLTVYYNSGQSHFTFERPLPFQLPSIPENQNLSLYYNFVDSKDMISVFAAMLAERRIIFTSSHLDRLSSCIQAANAFLYPMVWQHIFIPVLPWEFKDYLGAPMPYLIGVPEPVLETVSADELGEVVILNCDTKMLETPFDDVRALPPEIVSQLKKHLSHTQDHIGDRISKIFLGALVQLIGGYRDAVEFHDTCKTFNRDKFIESRPAHLRPFLTKMMELQIFAQFIDDRLKMLNSGLGFSDEFERETVRYAEKMKKRGRNYVFLKHVKDKVKESSRGVKTAYKKWRDNGNGHNHNPNHQFHFGLSSPQHSDRPDGSSNSLGGYGRKVTHRSAPSSPVCSKRLEREINLNGSAAREQQQQAMLQLPQQRRAPVPLVMSSSSSHIPANGYALGAPNNAHFDHIVGASPAVSSASSICSSEMNLSQELQNHPLFKTPAVDRSLKPNAEQQHSTRLRSGAPPARPPPPTLPASQPAAYYNHPYAPNTNTSNGSNSTRGNPYPINNLKPPRHTSTPTKVRPLASTDSSFDNPPDMQSPPIPPRRQCSANVVVAATAAAVSAGINRLERNCWQDEQNNSMRSSNNSSASSASASSSSSCASFVTAASRFSQLNISSPQSSDSAPIPTPRAKRESPRSSNSSNNAQPNPQDSMNDLISLDDSNNTSFDLEDFDPLNQNARPLPTLGKTFGSNHKSKSSTLPAGVNSSVINNVGGGNSVNNPLYPYFAPKHMATVAAVTNRVVNPLPPQNQRSSNNRAKPPDDDFELLRKYGLDQFSLNTSTETTATGATTKPALTAGAGGGKGMNNWTTFD